MNISSAWLPVVRATALGCAPLATRSLPKLPNNFYLQDSGQTPYDEILTLNLSGTVFRVYRSSLERYPETLLGSLEREFFYNDENHEYFFERDPELFRHILNYYRTGKLHFPRHECLTAFEEELVFFGISNDVIGDCCDENYQDRTKENQQRLLDDKEPEDEDTSHMTLRERMWLAFESSVTLFLIL